MANAFKYAPKESLGKFPAGIAKVKVGKKSAKITFQDDAIEFASGDNSEEFNLSDLPKTPHLQPDSVNEYFVKLSRNREEVLSIGPVEGIFDGKCVDLSRPQGEDSEPAPYEKRSEQHPEWKPYHVFNAYFEIQKGAFKGVRVSQFHHYKFKESPDGEVVWDGQPDNPKAKWLPILTKFCEKTGCVEEPMEWPADGNVLPELLDRILAASKPVKIVISNGYVESLLSPASYDDDDEKPSRKVQSAAKKVAPARSNHKPAAKKSKRDEL